MHFFVHPYNILLSVLVDEMKGIRELDARRNKLDRQKACEKGTDYIRIFEIPTLNIGASDYYDLVKWQVLEKTQPPTIVNVSDFKIDNAIETAEKWTLNELYSLTVERKSRLSSKLQVQFVTN